MFAIAIWDAKRRRLVLARDRFGIKPLYYRDLDGELSFASELDALPRGELDLDALEAFLATNTVPAPLSIFRESRKLLPGHVLVWEAGAVSTSRFARPGPLPERADDEAELVEECRARLRDSVRAHLVSDVPVGVLLSGGVDSGVLTALAAGESSEAVRTFSIGFEEQSFDELTGAARSFPARYGTRHRGPRPAAGCGPCVLPALAAAFDEPFADSSALPTYLVSKLAAEDVKVALSGEGSDELFGGYYTYAADAPGGAGSSDSPRSPGRRSNGCRPPRGGRVSTTARSASCGRGAPTAPRTARGGWKTIFSPDARAELTGRTHAWDPLALQRARFAETEGSDLLARLQDVDLGGYLADDLLVKTDRASMAWSLETRVPFLDPLVASFAFSLPRRLKVRGLDKKRLLRKVAEPLLPRSVVHGRKRGFSIPAAAWLRGGLEPFAREDARGRCAAQAGLPAPGGGDRGARPARERRRGSLAAALGAACLHALVRAARRGSHPRGCGRGAGLGLSLGPGSRRLPEAATVTTGARACSPGPHDGPKEHVQDRRSPGFRTVSLRVPTSRPNAVEATRQGVTRGYRFVHRRLR